mmetsp:Transcript_26696/g.4753  ORF Transcript_26696/g.4753 Transcript_26696/m.4753 type:complete len:95 (-) Transcript_26696:811-1095(-)
MNLTRVIGKIIGNKLKPVLKPDPKILPGEVITVALKRISINLHVVLKTAMDRWVNYRNQKYSKELENLFDRVINKSTLGQKQAFTKWARAGATA